MSLGRPPALGVSGCGRLQVHGLWAELAQPASCHEPLPPPPGGQDDPALRTAIREALREHGYRPAGRGKPSSEYLSAALADGRWPRLGAVVDCGNHVSLRHGVPISVCDADLLLGPLCVRPQQAGARYVFHQSGQEIELAGLPCLCDQEGPCANAVKDSLRTKVRPVTWRALAIVWGAAAVPQAGLEAAEELAARWRQLGARVERLHVTQAP